MSEEAINQLTAEFVPQEWRDPNVFAVLWADLNSKTGSLGFSRNSKFLELSFASQQEIVNDWITLLYELEAYLEYRKERDTQ